MTIAMGFYLCDKCGKLNWYCHCPKDEWERTKALYLHAILYSFIRDALGRMGRRLDARRTK